MVFEYGACCPAVTYVGVRPTVDDGDSVTVESFLLHFDGDLYGQTLRTEFYSFIRPERKFSSLAELQAEVMRNAQQADDFFTSHP